MSIIPVYASGEAREHLAATLKRFRAQGPMAEPLIFGTHRRPEAAVIPFELYESLLPAIEELEIAAIVRERAGQESRPLGELAESIGLDPADYS